MKLGGVIIVVMLLLIFIPVVQAGSVAYGYVYITIANKVPELKNLRLTSQEVYSDSSIDCLADVIDESPALVTIEKKWFVNEKEVSILEFNEGDFVRCELLPMDARGQSGAIYSLSFRIQESPEDIAFAQQVLDSAGISKSVSELIIMKQSGFNSITGFVSMI